MTGTNEILDPYDHWLTYGDKDGTMVPMQVFRCLEARHRSIMNSKDELYKEFTELVKERDELKIKLEETTAEWDHEITCCRNILDDRVEEIERLKLIIRTVELLAGGKILDE